MFNILVVDDEAFARSAILYAVSKSGFQCGWIMEAASAEEALSVIAENRPDVLITDIRMDSMNGIELIRQSKKIHPEIISMIVCGYPDFSYAQEAIRLEVIEYILKPVRQEQINTALAKASIAYYQQKKMIRLSSRNEFLETYHSSQKIQEQLEMFLNGIQSEESASVSSLFPQDARFFQVFQFHICLKEDTAASREEYDLFRFGIRNAAEELGKTYLLSFNSYAEFRQITMIAASAEPALEQAKEQLAGLLAQIHHILTRGLKIRLHIGVSSVQDCLCTFQMSQAKQALDMRLFPNSNPIYGSVFLYENCGKNSAPTAYAHQLKTFQLALENGNSKDAVQIVHEMISKAALSAYPIRLIYSEIICTLSRCCMKKRISILSFLGTESVTGNIVDHFDSLDELMGSLKKIVQTAIQNWMQDGDSKNVETLMSRVKDHINQHFADHHISTKTLSDEFCISLGYLSATFKKLYGITISKYILSLRMQYAESLLTTTALSIQDIAEMSGFNNMSYFMRVFKSYHQSTPSKYRNSRPEKTLNTVPAAPDLPRAAP